MSSAVLPRMPNLTVIGRARSSIPRTTSAPRCRACQRIALARRTMLALVRGRRASAKDWRPSARAHVARARHARAPARSVTRAARTIFGHQVGDRVLRAIANAGHGRNPRHGRAQFGDDRRAARDPRRRSDYRAAHRGGQRRGAAREWWPGTSGAQSNPVSVALVGAGVQGAAHVEVLAEVAPAGSSLTVADRHPERADELRERAGATGMFATVARDK